MLASPSALSALHEVLLRVASGNLPENAAAALAASKLTALRKPGGGVRPIAAPSLLRRLAGRGLVRARRAELEAALGHRQFAVGTAAGAELLAHSVRALTEAEPDLVLVALDARNAFCSADRAACLRALGELAPELVPCADLFSGRLSRYFFWDSSGRAAASSLPQAAWTRVTRSRPCSSLAVWRPGWQSSKPTCDRSLRPAVWTRTGSASSPFSTT